ncbi:hypothetical protein L9F63_013703 [Diploptera punctata]|uniref:DNL-type domain-containing protein n=1 Tax=Diploptera punctata TaxID=6984 RepID=A0AAD8A9H1_DIPPU|nr:hypothetical protein L9F63_013703 [Diploptera punctata]
MFSRQGQIVVLFTKNLTKSASLLLHTTSKECGNLLKIGKYPERSLIIPSLKLHENVHTSATICCERKNEILKSDDYTMKNRRNIVHFEDNWVNDNKTRQKRSSPIKPKVAKLTGRFQLVYTFVIVCCQGCNSRHLIADNLKWFSNNKNIEDILATKGEAEMKVTNHEVFLEVVPPDTPDALPKDQSNEMLII